VAWAVLAAATFGYIEWLSLKNRKDDRPPLTEVIKRFVPRWLFAVVLGGFAAWLYQHILL
jgi:hypothetical protein